MHSPNFLFLRFLVLSLANPSTLLLVRLLYIYRSDFKLCMHGSLLTLYNYTGGHTIVTSYTHFMYTVWQTNVEVCVM